MFIIIYHDVFINIIIAIPPLLFHYNDGHSTITPLLRSFHNHYSIIMVATGLPHNNHTNNDNDNDIIIMIVMIIVMIIITNIIITRIKIILLLLLIIMILMIITMIMIMILLLLLLLIIMIIIILTTGLSRPSGVKMTAPRIYTYDYV